MKKYITIIGSRNITELELDVLRQLADKFHAMGYILRSGGANGSDSAINHLENVQIIIPWNGYNGFWHDGCRIFTLDKLPDQALAAEIVRKIHPNPTSLSPGAFKLHARNAYQIAGVNGLNQNELSEAVFYCADTAADGLPRGGTRTAVLLAMKNGIKTYNIRDINFLEGGNKWKQLNWK
jgi:hypothetical protein